PDPWADAPVVVVDDAALSSNESANTLADRLHVAWATRQPTVIEWHVDPQALAVHETFDGAPWAAGGDFLFPLERLRFLCFSNNYDARSGEPKWWWAVKASSIGASQGGPADVLLNGTPHWIDGGPRGPLDSLDHAIVHGESIDMGRERTVPTEIPLVSDLAVDQAAAVAHVGAAARIIAPAGSGKTRTLAARLTHLIDGRAIEPGLVIAVAYNTRAASELRERVAGAASTVRTIHSLGWAILRESNPTLDLIGERDVRNVLGNLVSVPQRANSDPMGPYIEALEQVRSGLFDPGDVEAERDDVPGFADAFEPYRQRLYGTGRVDHGEQVYGAIEALLRDPDLRGRWQNRCRHLLVDEFQDLTPAYLLLLRLVASPQLQVFGVGDDDQVIYGYAGADPGYLIDFDTYFPAAHHYALETNYRCPPDVVVAATTLLGYNDRRIDKTIKANRTSDGVALTVKREDNEQLAIIARDTIVDWIEAGIRTDEIAVLSRVNSSLIPLKAALAEAGVATNDLLSADSIRRTTLRALFAWMRLAADPEAMQRSDVLEAVRRPGRGLNRIAQNLGIRRISELRDLESLSVDLDAKQASRWASFCQDLERVSRVARNGDAGEVIDSLIDEIGLGSSARTLDSGRGNASRSSHLDDLVAIRRAAAIRPRLDGFIEWITQVVATRTAEDGVTLSSVHRVKGMEWSRVIVFGVDRGALPHDLASDTEEERRVFHVAITRAIDQSVVLADKRRPSRFLGELDGSAPKRTTEPKKVRFERAPAKPAFALPAVGDTVRIAGGYKGTVTGYGGDEITVMLDRGVELTVAMGEIKEVTKAASLDDDALALVELLKAWRLTTSRERNVPAFVVFHDATLEDIARRRPRSEAELLEVAGIGAKKLEEYGDDVLAIVADAG
ncbi:MAG: UvrD-helicase domain-containing protein, partial [Acidimicrobiia bacterium]|nr:UvrD-helicase domain-containing protein [Acidimicrobiia bacterium]